MATSTAMSAVNDLKVEETTPATASPKLTRTAISSIEKTENTGVPLNSSWTFWLDKSIRGTSAAEYEAALRKLYTVSTVQETVWKELLLAAIGENLSDCMADGDEVSGLTVSIRDRDDIIQIWNVDATLQEQSTIVDRVKQLCPAVNFSAIFYKAFQTHQAFEGSKGY